MVTNAIPVSDDIVILTHTDMDADANFQDDMPDRLAVEGFIPEVPPTIRSQRTIICFSLDELVYGNPAETIAEEVGLRHGWAKVNSVYKFPRSSTVKIIFKDADMAKKVFLEGLNLFHIHISSYQLPRVRMWMTRTRFPQRVRPEYRPKNLDPQPYRPKRNGKYGPGICQGEPGLSGFLDLLLR
ncbi:hypothetical protein E2C01_051122 [Portunus trituberculatus]|uniref:Uncharacterized protein n=1 Tax=Portunus trituberculatus TaxID=210409 RepID=A0A5B7GJC0_PORTR|nr:hypothetical protein [Portunus trituberculatus]